MKKIVIYSLLIVLTGCGSTRSISNYDWGSNQMYNGELSQLEVLSEFCTGNVRTVDKDVTINSGTKVILIQSGKLSPEANVVAEISKKVVVVPISGIPPKLSGNGITWNQVARLGGVNSVICYWGEIETGYSTADTAIISWVPFVGAFIPDTAQVMRIKGTLLIIDIETGNWTQKIITTKETTINTAVYNRHGQDIEHIESHKVEMYNSVVSYLSSIIR